MTETQDYIVLSLDHTLKAHNWITLWAPKFRGYCWPLDNAGRYTAEEILEKTHILNNGRATLAIPVEDALRLAVSSHVYGPHDPNDAISLLLANNKETRENLERVALQAIHRVESSTPPSGEIAHPGHDKLLQQVAVCLGDSSLSEQQVRELRNARSEILFASLFEAHIGQRAERAALRASKVLEATYAQTV